MADLHRLAPSQLPATLQVWCIAEAPPDRDRLVALIGAAAWSPRWVRPAELHLSLASFAAPDLLLAVATDTAPPWEWLDTLERDPVGRDVAVVVVNLGSEPLGGGLLRRGVSHCLEGDFGTDELAAALRLALESRRGKATVTGSLGQLSAADLLQTAAVARRSGVLLLRRGRRAARLSLVDGRVLDAVSDDGRRGVEVVYDVALWEDGTFEADFRQVEVAHPTIDEGIGSLLLEAARRADEAAREATARPHAALPDPPPLPAEHQIAGHRALTLAAIAIGWASEHLQLPLVVERFDRTRRELAKELPLLERFALEPTGRARWQGPAPEPDQVGALVVSVARWIRVTFDQLERARPGRFGAQTLAALTEAIGDDLAALGFDHALGIKRETHS